MLCVVWLQVKAGLFKLFSAIGCSQLGLTINSEFRSYQQTLIVKVLSQKDRIQSRSYVIFCDSDSPCLLQLFGGVHGERFALHGERADLDAGLDQAQLLELLGVL